MIRPGQEWGTPAVLRGDEPVAHTDAELAVMLDTPGVVCPVVLTGGDLFYSLGGRVPPEPIEMPIDLLDVMVDGRSYVAASHVVARRRWWRGQALVAMNGTHLGDWNLGPKAHPNDGLVDITFGKLSLVDRWKAAKRAPAGAHVPHPALTTKRTKTFAITLGAPTPIFVDGVSVGSGRTLEFTVRPDVGSIVLGPVVTSTEG